MPLSLQRFTFRHLSVLALAVLVLSQTGIATGSHEPGIDMVLLRGGAPVAEQVVSIDEINAQIGGRAQPRSTLDWIAFNGQHHVPGPQPVVMHVDVIELQNGEWLLGKLVSLNRGAAIIDTGALNTFQFSQIKSVSFCDAPCLVSPGARVDPVAIASEITRFNIGRANAGRVFPTQIPPTSTPTPIPPTSTPTPVPPVVSDPFAGIRGQVVTPTSTATLTPTLTPTVTNTPILVLVTATHTPIVTPSATPTVTPTPTITPTPTVTPQFVLVTTTPVQGGSSSAAPTPTTTTTPTPSGTLSIFFPVPLLVASTPATATPTSEPR